MKRSHAIVAGLGIVATGGVSLALFPPLRDAIGVAQPSSAEFVASRSLFASALDGVAARDLAARSVDVGLDANAVVDAWRGTLLKEPEGQCAGRGIYLVRSDTTLPLAVTAPHRGADRHTGTLAAQLFAESGAAAAAWNSAPRSPTAECPNALDLARAGQHPFTAFALAFAEVNPRGRIVQLHGFDRDKRADEAGRSAGLIVSNGTTEVDDALLDLADCLSVALDPHPVRVFPLETRELGALTNAQGAALRETGFNGFVHLELAADVRRQLTGDPALRAAVLQCLARGIG